MASYDASINVRVSGTSMVDGVINRVQELERLVRDINTRPLNLSRTFGRGDIADRFGAAARELNSLKNSFINSERAVEAFGTTAGRTIANTTALASSFKQIAANSEITTSQFREFTVAAQQAAVAANSLGRARLSILAEELSGGTGPGGPRNPRTPDPFGASRTIGGPSLVDELIAQRTAIPNSIAALNAYQGELRELQSLVTVNGDAYWRLERAILGVDRALNQTRIPAFPPPPPAAPRPAGGTTRPGARGGPPPGSLAFNPNPSQENLALGAGFPLLFGGGVGQVAGGLLGSFAGTGFGGQILGSAIGQILEDAYVRTVEVSRALDTLNMDALRDSVVVVNGELEYQVQLLLRAGQTEEARAAAAKAVFEQTGLSAGAAEDIADNADRLKNAWDGALGSISAAFTQLVNLFLPGLSSAVSLVGTVFKGWSMIGSVIGDSARGLKGWIQDLVFGEGTSAKVQERFGGVNEEVEKLKANLKAAVDTQLRSATTGKQLLEIEKQRTIDVGLQGKLSNIELDKKAKIIEIERDADQKRKDALLKYGGLKDAASQKELAALLLLIDAESRQGIETAKLVAARERLLAINATLVEQDKVRIALLQMQGEIAKASEDANEKVRASQIQELEQRKQIALSLNDELSAVNSIYTQKKQGIDAAYAAAKREADLKVQTAALDLASIKAQKARGLATDEQVVQAQNVYKTAVAVTQETLRGAEAVKSAATSAADLERRQQIVAAYAGQFARNTQQASNALNEQAAAIDNQTKLVQAQNLAYITINNIQIDSLRTQLEATKNEAQRAQILNRIRDLEIDNATAILYTTRSQISAEVERQRIAYQQVQLRYEELKATVNIARAQNLLNQDYLNALENQRSALAIAQDNYKTSQGIAKANWRAADAVYNAAVKAATLKSQTQGAAAAAGQFAGSMERAANGMRGIQLQGFSQLEPWMEQKIAAAKAAAIKTSRDPFASYIAGINAEIQLRTQFEKILNAERMASNTQAESDFWAKASSLGFGKFASGGYVTGPTLGLVGEGGESEYIIPESKMAAASANYLAGGRGAGIMEGGGGAAPSINITTGPVVEFNGERYVTMRDMERGLQQMASNIYSGLRTPAGRYAVGVR